MTSSTSEKEARKQLLRTMTEGAAQGSPAVVGAYMKRSEVLGLGPYDDPDWERFLSRERPPGFVALVVFAAPIPRFLSFKPG